uniref:Uncharacterized protein n=1 Tax=Romanomermis culicivorax TaxID=13658 RepID=A0A915JP59_ROMCU
MAGLPKRLKSLVKNLVVLSVVWLGHNQTWRKPENFGLLKFQLACKILTLGPKGPVEKKPKKALFGSNFVRSVDDEATISLFVGQGKFSCYYYLLLTEDINPPYKGAYTTPPDILGITEPGPEKVARTPPPELRASLHRLASCNGISIGSSLCFSFSKQFLTAENPMDAIILHEKSSR